MFGIGPAWYECEHLGLGTGIATLLAAIPPTNDHRCILAANCTIHSCSQMFHR